MGEKVVYGCLSNCRNSKIELSLRGRWHSPMLWKLKKQNDHEAGPRWNWIDKTGTEILYRQNDGIKVSACQWDWQVIHEIG